MDGSLGYGRFGTTASRREPAIAPLCNAKDGTDGDLKSLASTGVRVRLSLRALRFEPPMEGSGSILVEAATGFWVFPEDNRDGSMRWCGFGTGTMRKLANLTFTTTGWSNQRSKRSSPQPVSNGVDQTDHEARSGARKEGDIYKSFFGVKIRATSLSSRLILLKRVR
jgi:hypothetical protein